MSIIAADDTVYVQQCMKWNYRKDVIWSKLWISSEGLKRLMSAWISELESDVEHCRA